jgi:hypothetical protein
MRLLRCTLSCLHIISSSKSHNIFPFACSRADAPEPRHPRVPSSEETGAEAEVHVPQLLVQPTKFTLRSELLHVFISYRVATEGPKGNGLSSELYRTVRALSLDMGQDLNIPSYGWGIWPRFAREVRPPDSAMSLVLFRTLSMIFL